MSRRRRSNRSERLREGSEKRRSIPVPPVVEDTAQAAYRCFTAVCVSASLCSQSGVPSVLVPARDPDDLGEEYVNLIREVDLNATGKCLPVSDGRMEVLIGDLPGRILKAVHTLLERSICRIIVGHFAELIIPKQGRYVVHQCSVESRYCVVALATPALV